MCALFDVFAVAAVAPAVLVVVILLLVPLAVAFVALAAVLVVVHSIQLHVTLLVKHTGKFVRTNGRAPAAAP